MQSESRSGRRCGTAFLFPVQRRLPVLCVCAVFLYFLLLKSNFLEPHVSSVSHVSNPMLLPLDSGSRSSLNEVASNGPNQEGEEEGAAPSASFSSAENVKLEHSGVSVGGDAWEEYGCILWDFH